MKQSRKELTPQQFAGRVTFHNINDDHRLIDLASDEQVRNALAFARTMLTLPDGGAETVRKLKAELKKRTPAVPTPGAVQ